MDDDIYNFDETGFMMGIIFAGMVVTTLDGQSVMAPRELAEWVPQAHAGFGPENPTKRARVGPRASILPGARISQSIYGVPPSNRRRSSAYCLPYLASPWGIRAITLQLYLS
jgi:hypothetical protein